MQVSESLVSAEVSAQTMAEHLVRNAVRTELAVSEAAEM